MLRRQSSCVQNMAIRPATIRVGSIKHLHLLNRLMIQKARTRDFRYLNGAPISRGRVCDLNRHEQRCRFCQFLLPTEQNTPLSHSRAPPPKDWRQAAAPLPRRSGACPLRCSAAVSCSKTVSSLASRFAQSQREITDSLWLMFEIFPFFRDAGPRPGAIVAAWCGTESDSTNPMEIQAMVRDRAMMSPNDPPVSTTRNIYREVLKSPRTLRSLAPGVSGCTFNASARSQPLRDFGREILVVVGCQRSRHATLTLYEVADRPVCRSTFLPPRFKDAKVPP